MAYEHQEYPKWKYRGLTESKLVQNSQEEAELGDDWGDAPGAATAPKEENGGGEGDPKPGDGEGQ